MVDREGNGGLSCRRRDISDLPKNRLAAAELRGLEEYHVGVAASGCERCGVFEIRRHDLPPRVGAVDEYLRVSGDRVYGMFLFQLGSDLLLADRTSVFQGKCL